MGAEENSCTIQKRTEVNKKIFGNDYRSRRDVKETATSQHGNEKEE